MQILTNLAVAFADFKTFSESDQIGLAAPFQRKICTLQSTPVNIVEDGEANFVYLGLFSVFTEATRRRF